LPETKPSPIPDALLVITAGCPHCPAVLAGLTDLMKAGKIGKLEVINAAVYPERAEALNIRSVPWVKLGAIELEGMRTASELGHWVEVANSSQGMGEYLSELFRDGELGKVIGILKNDPSQFEALLDLMVNPETELHVRVGISAAMEEFAGSRILQKLIPRLGKLTEHHEAHVRGDACHYLGLTRHPDALPWLKAHLTDPEPQVRELAEDGLKSLQQANLA
jgi:hypothetical protein